MAENLSKFTRPHPRPVRHPRKLIGRADRRGSTRWWLRISWLDTVIALVLFVGSLALNISHIDTRPFHPDESRWLNRSYYIEDLDDPYGTTWQDYYLTQGQPPLGSYMIGIGQLVQGGSMHPNLVWDFYFGNDAESGSWNVVSGAMPSLEDLDRGRRTSTFVGALVIAATYLLGRMLSNRVGGVAGAIVLLLHPLHVWIGSQALSDQLLNLFLVLSFIAAYKLAQRPGWPLAILLGTLLGLGGATKLTPVLLTIPLAGLGCFLLLRPWLMPEWLSNRTRDKHLGIMLLAQPLIGFAVFVLVYPYLWVDPIRRSWKLFNFRQNEMDAQGSNDPAVVVSGPVEAFHRIGLRLGDQFQSFNHVEDRLNDWFGWSFHLANVDLILGLTGLMLLAVLIVRNGITSPVGLVGMLAGAETGAIILGLKSDLYRYYLPLVLINCLCISLLIGVLWRYVLAPYFTPWAQQLGINPGTDSADLGAFDPPTDQSRPSRASHYRRKPVAPQRHQASGAV